MPPAIPVSPAGLNRPAIDAMSVEEMRGEITRLRELEQRWHEAADDHAQLEATLQEAREELERRDSERTAELHITNQMLWRETEVRMAAEQEREQMHLRLQEAMAQVLNGFIPICSGCKSVRNEDDKWVGIETYLHQRTEARLTHGICPRCADRLYEGHEL